MVLTGDGPAPGFRPVPSDLDALTGAVSRSRLDHWLPAGLERARRDDRPFSLCLFDVDHFKRVNDAYGHARGDAVLRAMVERIQPLTRPADLLVRYGGDEFVLLLPDVGKAAALAQAQRLVDGLAGSPLPGSPPLSLSVSIGVASYPEDARTPDALLLAADRRNYLAKSRGRGRAVADDRTTEPTAVAGEGRLLQREDELSRTRAFLSRLEERGWGLLRVAGPSGAGHTRFLAEVGTLAQMRGFRIFTSVAAADAAVNSPGPAPAPAKALIVLDEEETLAFGEEPLERIAARFGLADPSADPAASGGIGSTGTPAPVVGVVCAAPGPVTAARESLAPLVATVALSAWSGEVISVWLRSALSGEPSRALVDLLIRRADGLPARLARELGRIRDGGDLRRDAAGRWTVGQCEAGRPEARSALPAPLSDLVGRDRQRDEVAALLGGERLVTLIGPGGIGKTRLALAAAGQVEHTLADGVVFVSLAEAGDAAAVAVAIATALRIEHTGAGPLVDAVREHLAGRDLLLVLDNFEHVLAAAPLVGDLLAAARRLRVLVTSREQLVLPDEQVHCVPPLSLPPAGPLPTDPAAISRLITDHDAVGLFVARAEEADYGFQVTAATLPAVVEICRRLDGLPLAIELAAARCDQFSPQRMLTQLDRSLEVLTHGTLDGPERHQTLRATVEWSVRLLDPATRTLLARLGVFAGGATATAALRVCGRPELPGQEWLTEGLATLVGKNLLTAVPEPGGRVRYTMLETIRAYAVDRLVDGPDAEAMRRRYAEYFAELAVEAETELVDADQITWHGLLERDRANVTTALAWALDHGRLDVAVPLVVGLRRFWVGSHHREQGRVWCDRLLAVAALPAESRVDVLRVAVMLAADQFELAGARKYGMVALGLAREIGDVRRESATLNVLSIVELMAGNTALARTYSEGQLALDRILGDRHGVAIALNNLAQSALFGGEVASADAQYSEALALLRDIEDTGNLLVSLTGLAQVHVLRGEVEAVRPLVAEILALSHALGDPMWEAMALQGAADVARLDGNLAEARRLVTRAVTLAHGIDDVEVLVDSLEQFGGLIAEDLPELAARALGCARAIRVENSVPTSFLQQARSRTTRERLRGRLGEAELTAMLRGGDAAGVAALVDEVASGDGLRPLVEVGPELLPSAS